MLIKLKANGSWCSSNEELEQLAKELRNHFNTRTNSKAFGLAATKYLKLHDEHQALLLWSKDLESKILVFKESLENKNKAESDIMNLFYK